MQHAHPIIQPFLNHLQFEKRYSQHTIISYQTDLVNFLDYLQLTYGGIEINQLSHIYIRSLLDKTPMTKICAPKNEKRLPTFVFTL